MLMETVLLQKTPIHAALLPIEKRSVEGHIYIVNKKLTVMTKKVFRSVPPVDWPPTTGNWWEF